MGPMSVRVASYFPFNVTCYLNGHSFVALSLDCWPLRFPLALATATREPRFRATPLPFAP